jgi:hypothetical protein
MSSSNPAIDITGDRLHNQRLSAAPFASPDDVVSWLGAVQAQDYAGATWALALRMRRGRAAAIESAFAAGMILRTHVLRPTWHFVTPADIRWMLTLTGPRVSAAMAPYNRRLELDATVFRRSHRAIRRALEGGHQLTRSELKGILQREGILPGTVQRLAHIVMQAELDGVICSGAIRGKQFTYALLDERVPPSRPISRDEALAELTRRYFISHGPAQLHDFAWWSGLTVGDARAGLAMVERHLARAVVDGKTYWFSSSARPRRSRGTAFLLPLYDEYLIAYKDRRAALDPARWAQIAARDAFAAPIVVDGRVVGGWKRIPGRTGIRIRLMPFTRCNKSEVGVIEDAARCYGRFLGVDPELSWE